MKPTFFIFLLKYYIYIHFIESRYTFSAQTSTTHINQKIKPLRKSGRLPTKPHKYHTHTHHNNIIYTIWSIDLLSFAFIYGRRCRHPSWTGTVVADAAPATRLFLLFPLDSMKQIIQKTEPNSRMWVAVLHIHFLCKGWDLRAVFIFGRWKKMGARIASDSLSLRCTFVRFRFVGLLE